ncbi:MAG: TrkA family potassium uptake protein [Clostridiaceae bacterium]
MYIIIIGCGRLGSNLARELADDGHDICILDRDGDRLNRLGSGFNGQRIKGVEYDSDKLTEAGIKLTDAVLAVTPDDNINIMVSLIAERIYHVPKIIARVNDPEKNYIYNKLGIETINPVQSGIEILKNKLLVENLNIVSALDDNYEIIELLVDKEKSVSVEEIETKYSCVISVLIKDGIISLPEKNDLIQNGNRIICTIQKQDKGRLIHSLSREIIL